MKSWGHCLGVFVPEEIAYSFFNFLFDILELYKFGLWVSQLGNEDLVSDYIFTSQRESHSLPYMVFSLTFNYFVPFGVIENRFTKIKFKILMEIVTVPVVLFDEFCFYMYRPIKAWLFEKVIFELVYLFHVVLKWLLSY